jgi:hypothetical protein
LCPLSTDLQRSMSLWRYRREFEYGSSQCAVDEPWPALHAA